MSEKNKSKQNTGKRFEIKSISLDEKQRLVGTFAWLIEQDKKQNPDLYKNKQNKND
jgi:hypothetical protein